MTLTATALSAACRARRRAGAEHGFTMLFAVAALAFVSLVTAAIFTAVVGDEDLNEHTLNAQRAYDAATAGAQDFLYQLNQNPNYWATCSNDVQAETSVPGSTTGEQYSYTYVPANGAVTCTGTPPTASLIDNSTASLRMEFTGYSGNVKRTIVASFRKASPLDFLWYTVYEALDKSISGYSGCGVFLRNGRNINCDINWVTGDVINGPMYTEDQYLIYGNNTPVFGRNANDKIESAAPGTNTSDICDDNQNNRIVSDNCGGAQMNGTPVPDAPVIAPPQSNTNLYTDATTYGKTYTGVTTITLNGTNATVVNCPSSCTTSTVNLTQYPVIYVSNGSNCTPYAYSPFTVNYETSGCVGDVYVSGNYSTSLTIGAANNIIIDGSVTTSSSGQSTLTGNAVLGLIANAFIRVMHGVTYDQSDYCDNNSNNISSQTFPNMTIDAAMLAIQHSFIVDNFSCGASLGNLTVNGAIAQNFRGAVGTTANTGYIKNYTYDDRLKVLAPPYLFDISTADWELSRETLCTLHGTGSTAC